MTLTRKQIVVCCLIISFLTLAAYSSSLDNGFVNWDDPPYVIDNYSIRSLAPHNLIQLFARPQASYYAPLVFLSYSLEFFFWELNPFAYHLTNLLLHIINSLLVFVFIYLLQQSRAKALHYERKGISIPFFTAILFAIHPLHVESVAWITERKDVLSLFFYLLSIIFFLKYRIIEQGLLRDLKETEKFILKNRLLKVSSRSLSISYIFSLFCFLAALLSKPMAVTLPLVLLLIDYYIRHNPDVAKGISLSEINGELKLAATSYRLIRNSILNKIPFFVLSIVFAFIALSLQKTAGTLRAAFYLDPLPHILTACRNFVFYPIKLLFPLKLSAYYPYPSFFSFFLPSFFFPIIIVITMFLIVSRCRKNNPSLLFGLGFYAITILPTLQLIPVGNVIFADRFSYLPSIGLFFLIALAIYSPQRRREKLAPDFSDISDNKKLKQTIFGKVFNLYETFMRLKTNKFRLIRCKKIFSLLQVSSKPLLYFFLCILFAILILSFSLLTFQRCLVWRNSETLWQDAIKKYPLVPTAHLNLGEALLNEGRLDEAIEAFYQSKDLDPNQANVYSNLGDAYQKQGLLKEAEEEFITALSLDLEDPIVHNNLGLVYAKQGIPNKARKEFIAAISLKPDYAEPHNNLGLIYSQEGTIKMAVEEFLKAISINCLYRDAYHNLANSLETQEKFGEAIDNYRKAIELKLDFAPAYNDLGFVYAKTGRLTEAITEFEKAINLNKELASAYYGLTLCYFFQGENDRAIQYRDQAIELGYTKIPPELMELE